MSDRSYVHFSTKDSYDDDEREPELQMRSPIENHRHLEAATGSNRPIVGRKEESVGSPKSSSHRHSVRFQQTPTANSPRVSSPVIRDPTPYHHHEAPLSEEEDSEDEVERTPRTKYSPDPWHHSPYRRAMESRRQMPASAKTPNKFSAPGTFARPGL